MRGGGFGRDAMEDTEHLHWYDDPAGWSAGSDGVKYLIRPHDNLYRAYWTRRDAPDHQIGPDSVTVSEAKALCEAYHQTTISGAVPRQRESADQRQSSASG